MTICVVCTIMYGKARNGVFGGEGRDLRGLQRCWSIGRGRSTSYRRRRVPLQYSALLECRAAVVMCLFEQYSNIGLVCGCVFSAGVQRRWCCASLSAIVSANRHWCIVLLGDMLRVVVVRRASLSAKRQNA